VTRVQGWGHGAIAMPPPTTALIFDRRRTAQFLIAADAYTFASEKKLDGKNRMTWNSPFSAAVLFPVFAWFFLHHQRNTAMNRSATACIASCCLAVVY